MYYNKLRSTSSHQRGEQHCQYKSHIRHVCSKRQREPRRRWICSPKFMASRRSCWRRGGRGWRRGIGDRIRRGVHEWRTWNKFYSDFLSDGEFSHNIWNSLHICGPEQHNCRRGWRRRICNRYSISVPLLRRYRRRREGQQICRINLLCHLSTHQRGCKYGERGRRRGRSGGEYSMPGRRRGLGPSPYQIRSVSNMHCRQVPFRGHMYRLCYRQVRQWGWLHHSVDLHNMPYRHVRQHGREFRLHRLCSRQLLSSHSPNSLYNVCCRLHLCCQSQCLHHLPRRGLRSGENNMRRLQRRILREPSGTNKLYVLCSWFICRRDESIQLCRLHCRRLQHHSWDDSVHWLYGWLLLDSISSKTCSHVHRMHWGHILDGSRPIVHLLPCREVLHCGRLRRLRIRLHCLPGYVLLDGYWCHSCSYLPCLPCRKVCRRNRGHSVRFLHSQFQTQARWSDLHGEFRVLCAYGEMGISVWHSCFNYRHPNGS